MGDWPSCRHQNDLCRLELHRAGTWWSRCSVNSSRGLIFAWTCRLMNLTALTFQLIAGAIAGYAAGNLSKEMNLGTIGNTIIGAVGGGAGGQTLFGLLGL